MVELKVVGVSRVTVVTIRKEVGGKKKAKYDVSAVTIELLKRTISIIHCSRLLPPLVFKTPIFQGKGWQLSGAINNTVDKVR